MGSKKLTAVLLATVLGISTAPINAWADSYTDVEAVAVTMSRRSQSQGRLKTSVPTMQPIYLTFPTISRAVQNFS